MLQHDIAHETSITVDSTNVVTGSSLKRTISEQPVTTFLQTTVLSLELDCDRLQLPIGDQLNLIVYDTGSESMLRLVSTSGIIVPRILRSTGSMGF
ncbi:hypothetical protein CROQUDRAFT_87403 [Cronartium quercuum f. sp. fusiforme G11]|uniref:Uncharacterized protein n=1 Tax=Cronartium quercuum f. sp. fusiforme G11 TaxID=708437 RepID=A0A9P6NWS6_9BASI|nr:hypothetical protein CROQUDRAFT_87403 [Cronartium quercuum f. sp. fusiforme G11]